MLLECKGNARESILSLSVVCPTGAPMSSFHVLFACFSGCASLRLCRFCDLRPSVYFQTQRVSASCSIPLPPFISLPSFSFLFSIVSRLVRRLFGCPAGDFFGLSAAILGNDPSDSSGGVDSLNSVDTSLSAPAASPDILAGSESYGLAGSLPFENAEKNANVNSSELRRRAALSRINK